MDHHCTGRVLRHHGTPVQGNQSQSWRQVRNSRQVQPTLFDSHPTERVGSERHPCNSAHYRFHTACTGGVRRNRSAALSPCVVFLLCHTALPLSTIARSELTPMSMNKVFAGADE